MTLPGGSPQTVRCTDPAITIAFVAAGPEYDLAMFGDQMRMLALEIVRLSSLIARSQDRPETIVALIDWIPFRGKAT